MWSATEERLSTNRGVKMMIRGERASMTFADVLDQWQASADFRTFFISLLATVPFDAFRWETPPITTASADRAFEFVLLESPCLAPLADPEAFRGLL